MPGTGVPIPRMLRRRAAEICAAEPGAVTRPEPEALMRRPATNHLRVRRAACGEQWSASENGKGDAS
jgi:hypothetical protein